MDFGQSTFDAEVWDSMTEHLVQVSLDLQLEFALFLQHLFRLETNDEAAHDDVVFVGFDF